MLFELTQDPPSYSSIIDNYCSRLGARLHSESVEGATALTHQAKEYVQHKTEAVHLPLSETPRKHLRITEHAPYLEHNQDEQQWQKTLVSESSLSCENSLFRLSNDALAHCQRDTPETMGAIGSVPACGGSIQDNIEMATIVEVNDTIADSLNKFLSAMMIYPDWQLKIHGEIDANLGQRMVAMKEDAEQLPTLRAAIQETMRWRAIVPSGASASSTETTIFAGSHTPTETTVHGVEALITRDSERQHSSEKFDPDRWLGSGPFPSTNPDINHPALSGHNQFDGNSGLHLEVSLIELELMAACSGILSAFELRHTTSSTGDSAEPATDLIPRCEDTKEKVAALWRQAEAQESVDM